MKLKGIVTDLDGVLTNTAHYHYLAWKQIAEELNFHFNEKDNERLKGVDRITSFKIMLEVNNALDSFNEQQINYYATKKNEYYNTLIKTMTQSDILPGIPEFIKNSKQKGLKIAVASVSRNAIKVLNYLGISDQFDYIADASKITKSKPDPEIFTTCAIALGFKPNECIGIEDAQSGIQAIHAAGMMSVGIGVDVTCLNPDVALINTTQLNINDLCDKFELFKEL